jgi:hypothetical protein
MYVGDPNFARKCEIAIAIFIVQITVNFAAWRGCGLCLIMKGEKSPIESRTTTAEAPSDKEIT